MSATIYLFSAVLLLTQPQLTTMEGPETGSPQLIAASQCIGSQHLLGDQPMSSREHRHGWYYRLVEKANPLSRRHVPVVGGLVPTANIAAQAGSINPVTTAITFSSGNHQRQHSSVLKRPVTQLPRGDRFCP